MEPTIFANQGTTAEHNTAIENAIHQGYAAINLGSCLRPDDQRAGARPRAEGRLLVSVYGATPAQSQQSTSSTTT